MERIASMNRAQQQAPGVAAHAWLALFPKHQSNPLQAVPLAYKLSASTTTRNVIAELKPYSSRFRRPKVSKALTHYVGQTRPQIISHSALLKLCHSGKENFTSTQAIYAQTR